ncbi:MAG: CHASE3 domain-containing protein, partial [Pyrinomonadaceae bacterium]
MRLTLEKQIPIVFAIAVFLLAVVVFFAFRSMSSLTEAMAWEKHTQEVLLQLDETMILMLNAETGVRGFMISGDETILEPYKSANQRVAQNMTELKILVSDNPEQTKRAAELEAIVNERMDFLAGRIALRRKSSFEEITAQFKDSRGRELSNKVRSIISEMKNDEAKLLSLRKAELNQKLIYTYRMFYLAGFAGILSLAFANFAIFREVRKRDKAEDEIRDVNKNLESRVEERIRELQQKNDELEDQIRQKEYSENRRRIALEAGNLGTWMFVPKTGKAEIDERSHHIFDILTDEFDGDGKHILSKIHKEDLRNVRKAFRESLKKDENLDVSFRYVLKDGKMRWLQCTGQPQSNGDTSSKHLIGHCRDITESKNGEDIIRASEMFTRSILDSLPAHIAVINKDGLIVSVNRAWEHFASQNCLEEKLELTGVGQNYLNICEKAQSFNGQTETILENLCTVLESKSEGFSVEYPCHSPTEERWFILQVSALKGGGGGAVISHIDITDRKLAETYLKNSEEFSRSIFENSPDCVNILELSGTLHSINDNGLRIMEIADLNNYVGKQWIDFWQGDENELAYQAVETARNGETANFEGFCLTAKETPKWWDVSVAPIFDSTGKPTRLISTSRDVTERRNSEQERERLLKNEQNARKDAEIANRLRDEFLATVSHELRAPLNSILGWARLMQKGKLDEKTTEKAVATIVRSSESQNRLIEDLLDVSRIISGKMRLEVMTVKPINFVESALETVRPAAEAKNITLEVVGDPVVSHISGDPNRLQQVMWNLLSNAIKFTSNGGRVTVEINRDSGKIDIKVKDTGVGIRDEFLPHVFDRFRQADASSIRKFGGLGLGLAIVRHITEMHGGTVDVESEGENKGATFTVSLPVVAAP